MLVRNEALQLVDTSAFANEILAEGLGDGAVTEQDAQEALANLYLSATKQMSERFWSNNTHANMIALSISGINKINLWDELKKIFCSIIQGDSIAGKIIDFVLEAIAHIIPLGVFVKSLVKVIIKFFLQQGIGKLCPAQHKI
ncbi:hypothetical protein A9P82_13630 [Arachidicoccus ginsenosidimutans]|uniref:hypothetical protein n=1 Tax=Arachidicoccus sp. BS20 TaxID=1850526 RepID=UPI0007F0AB40|nr:hypothetical protein [Arachidicoccus sp. BS20]ANI90239.1 hypothetical protein A9P82_13630 [Arachidicoccus sp. BS20]